MQQKEKKVLSEQGFTLVEVMIVVVILGLLVGLVGNQAAGLDRDLNQIFVG